MIYLDLTFNMLYQRCGSLDLMPSFTWSGALITRGVKFNH